MAGRRRRHGPLKGALTAASYIACHTFVAVCLILAIEVIKLVLRLFGEPKLFGVVPVSYLFDAMDSVIIVMFVVFGVFGARRWFRE